MSKVRDRYRLTILLLLLAGVAFRLHELTRQNIWWDEARNIDVALRPFREIPIASELDIHPPIYFWLLHVWARIFGLSDSTQVNVATLATPPQLAYIVRSFSAFVNMLGVSLLIALANLWHSRYTRHAIICITLVGTFSPFWIAESQEARMYTVCFTFLLVSANALIRSLPQESNYVYANTQRRLLFIFAFFAACSMLTHYNALFVVASWYLWWGGWALLQSDRWVWLRRITRYGLLMSACVIPITPIALRQIPGYRNPNLTVPSIVEYLGINWQTYFGGYAFTSDWFRLGSQSLDTVWFGVIGLVTILGLIISIRPLDGSQVTSIHKRYLSFLLVWLLGGLALYYIAVIDRGAFNPRYSSLVTPALYGLVGIGLSAWSIMNRMASFLGPALLLIGVLPGVAADIYDERFYREDMQQTVQWIAENAGPNDVVFVDQKYPFGFYYERFVIEADENYPNGSQAPARYLFVDINTIDERLSQWASNAEQVFWLQWFESDTDPRGSVSFLLNQTGVHGGRQNFRGYRVDWWTMEPPSEYELAPNMSAATYIFPPAVETVFLSLPESPIPRGSFAPIAIRWKRVTEGYTDRPLKARVALYRSGQESRLGQDDRLLLNDRHLMPSEWSIEDQPLNVYAIPVPPELPAGTYEARLLIYDEESLVPLTHVDLAGNPAGIEAVIGEVQVID